jgi:MFS family permease
MAITQTVLESPIELVGVPTRYDTNRTSTGAMPTGQPPENEAIDTATVTNTGNNDGDAPQANPKRSGLGILLVMAPLCLSSFLAALDLTIVTPAIPTIVSSFHAASGYVWIGSAFILAYTAVTPIWGSLADIWGRKPVMLLALMFFLGGSLLCALAPTMDSLIGGRVVLGLGASGMSVLTNTIICDTFSMRDRPLYLAITSLVWAVGSAIGPVLGGIFATQVG